jgi:galactokinase
MKTKIDQIVSILENGLSTDSMEEVAYLVEAIVEEEVAEHDKLMEARVAAFIRNKIDSLKDLARQEILAEGGTARQLEIFNAIKVLVSSEISGGDIDSMTEEYEDQIDALQEAVEKLNGKLEGQIQENSMLKKRNRHLVTESSQNSAAVSLLEAKLDLGFSGSDKAKVIHNDSDRPRRSEESENNRFLTEDVLRLSQKA